MKKEAQENYDKLMAAVEKIKKHFEDCDEQVDRFAQLIAPWYCAPELMSRPIVINMIGMTGVGKTQMFRQFAKELGIADLCRSITCTTKRETDPVGIAIRMREEGKERGIIFVDEFQNFTTKTAFGGRDNTASSGMFWDLLSDGKLDMNISKDMLERMIENISKEDQPGYKPFYSTIAFRLKLMSKSPKSIKEITSMTKQPALEFLSQVRDAYKNEPVFLDFSKYIIITSANIDCVFDDATDVASCDVDADEVYESTKNVNIFDVKEALGYYFFPEQVARLGNNFIIFHSLSRKSFEKIIDKELSRIATEVKENSGVELTFTDNVKQMLYRNGVFPTQGTRPLFSTINGTIASAIPSLLFRQKEADKNITIDYDDNKFELVAGSVRVQALGPYDESASKIKQRVNQRRCTSIHESGHAILYSECFGAIPRKMVSIVADSRTAAGFISTHSIRHTRVTMKDFICVALAGMVAEETVFGPDFRTVGCSSDLEKATMLAAMYIRKFAFSDKVKAVVGSDPAHYNNMSGTSEDINTIVKECIEKTKKVIEDNIEMLKDVAEVMFEKTKCSPEEFLEISKKHGKKYQIVPFAKQIMPNFEERYKMFASSKIKSMTEVSNASECVSFFDGVYVPSDTEMTLATDDDLFGA